MRPAVPGKVLATIRRGRPPWVPSDPPLLADLYADQTVKLVRIAHLFGVHRDTVAAAAKRMGVVMRPARNRPRGR